MYTQENLIGLRLTLKEVSADLLGKSVVKNIEDLYINAKKISKEFLYLQKCNCVELYFVLDTAPNKTSIESLKRFWAKHAIALDNELTKSIVVEHGKNVCLHLMRTACSLESVIIGDNQVLGQVKSARKDANLHKSLGPILTLLLKYTILAGNDAKRHTLINHGNVSIGRAVYSMIIEQEELSTSNILIVGSGKMGQLIAHLLSDSVNKNKLTIVNRTDEKAKQVGDKYQINFEKFQDLFTILPKYSIIIFATSSTHPLVNRKILDKTLIRNPITLIDIGNPPNIDIDVKKLNNIRLLSLDQIKAVSNRNLENRELCIFEVEKIIREKLNQLEEEYKLLPIYDKIGNIYRNAIQRQEKILSYYFEKNKLSKNNQICSCEIANRLTYSILYPIGQIRKLIKKENNLATQRKVKIIIDHLLSGY